jgi:hypothetical protein
MIHTVKINEKVRQPQRSVLTVDFLRKNKYQIRNYPEKNGKAKMKIIEIIRNVLIGNKPLSVLLMILSSLSNYLQTMKP